MVDLASFNAQVASIWKLIVYAEAGVGTVFLIGALALAAWCVADYLRGRPKRNASQRRSRYVAPPLGALLAIAAVSGPVLLMLSLTGCGPQFYHLDGRPLTPVLPPTSFDDGWIVIDSSADGLHALVEIRVEVPDAHVRSLHLERVAFRLASSDRWMPGRVRGEGPSCPSERLHGTAELRRGNQSDGVVNQVANVAGLPCTYTVHAEFEFDRRPVPSESVVVVCGHRVVRLVWR